MANEKYNLTFRDRFDNIILLEIHEVGVNNNPIAIKGTGNPITISYRSASDIFEPVLVSEATVEVISESDLFFKDFFTAPPGKYLLKVYKTVYNPEAEGIPILFWHGQNLTENYSEPYIINPYTSQIKFSDLGDLDFIYYKDGANFFTGFRTLAQIIADCTNKLTFNLDFTELINVALNVVFLESSITKKSCLVNTTLDSRAFIQYKDFRAEAMTCMEVLKRIMKAMGCRLFQHESRFYILRIEEATNAGGNITAAFDILSSNATVDGVQYTKNILKTIDNIALIGITPVGQNQDLSMSERLNKANHKYITAEALRKNDDLIFNNDFSKGVQTLNATGEFPAHYVPSLNITNDIACIVTVNASEEKILYFEQSGGLMQGFINAQTIANNMAFTSNINKFYLQPKSAAQDQVSKDVQLTTVDFLKIKIKGSLTKGVDYAWLFSQNSAPQNAANIIFRFGVYIKITYDNGAVYYLSISNWQPMTWAWGTSEKLAQHPIYTPSWENLTNGTEYHDDDFEILFDSPNFPEDGIATFDLRFYIPQQADTVQFRPGQLTAVRLTDFSVRYVSDGDFSDEITSSFTSFTMADSVKENIYDITVHLGDGPTNFILNTFRHPSLTQHWVYSYRQSNYTIPNQTAISRWRKHNDATIKDARDIFNLVPISKLLTSYQRKLKGDYLGEFGMLHALTITRTEGANVVTKRYLQLGNNYNVKEGIRSVDLQEISSVVMVIAPVLTAGPLTPSISVIAPILTPSIPSGPFVAIKNNIVISNLSSNPVSRNNNNTYPG